MSPPDSTEKRPGIYVQKPRPDVYTVLLGIALAAILVGILCLVLELREYGWVTKPPSVGLIPNWLVGDALSSLVRC